MIRKLLLATFGFFLSLSGAPAFAEVTPNPVVTGVASEPAITHRQVFTASGTFTVPSGVYTIYATLVGGGGGGGGGDNNATTGGGGGGGGSGGIYCRVPYLVTPGDTLTVTIGTGGTAGTGGASATGGGNGTSTVLFGSTAPQAILRVAPGRGGSAGADAAGGAGGGVGVPNLSFLFSTNGGAEGIGGTNTFSSSPANISFTGPYCWGFSGGGGNDNGGAAASQLTAYEDVQYTGSTNGGGPGGVPSRVSTGISRHLGAQNSGEAAPAVPAACYGCGGGGGFGAGGGTNGAAGGNGIAILEW